MPGPKYVKDFEFPSSFGFSGSASDRMTTPVKGYERSKPRFAEGGPVKDKDVDRNKDNTRVAQAPPPPVPKPKTGDTIQIDPKGSTIDTLKNQRERQMKELGLKRGGTPKKKLGGFLKKALKVGASPISKIAGKKAGKALDPVGSAVQRRIAPATRPAPRPMAPTGRPNMNLQPLPATMAMRSKKGGKVKYADGGRVYRFANDGIKTSGMNEGNASDLRSDPANNMDQQTGGKTPLRPYFKKGGRLKGFKPPKQSGKMHYGSDMDADDMGGGGAGTGLAKGGKFIQKAIKHPGAFTAKAKAQGMTPAQLQSKALKPGSTASTQTKRQANLRKTLVGMNHAEGGPLRRATGGPVTAARGGDIAQDRAMIKQAINKHVAAPKPRGHGVSKMRGGASY